MVCHKCRWAKAEGFDQFRKKRFVNIMRNINRFCKCRWAGPGEFGGPAWCAASAAGPRRKNFDKFQNKPFAKIMRNMNRFCKCRWAGPERAAGFAWCATSAAGPRSEDLINFTTSGSPRSCAT